MADTGYDWSAWTFVQDFEDTTWEEITIDDGTEPPGSTAISLDGRAACEVGIVLTAPDAAIDGVVTIFVFGAGVGYEESTAGVGSPWQLVITPVQNDTVYKRFAVSADDYGDFKLSLRNDSGQDLVTSVKYRTATIPLAS